MNFIRITLMYSSLVSGVVLSVDHDVGGDAASCFREVGGPRFVQKREKGGFGEMERGPYWLQRDSIFL